ncbi:MAG: TIGR00730 family Rossman fold protein [Pseudomonadota bacterium]
MTSTFSVCVFCGSRPGTDPAYLQAAQDVGAALADRQWRMVFGAGDRGMMGAVADAMGDDGNRLGIIPQHLVGFEAKNQDLGGAIITDDMHSRKKLMFVNSDAVVVLPGGAGSLDEFFEVLTWAQLGLHQRPVILVNIAGYWDPLIALIDHVIAQGFADASLRQFFSTATSVAETIAQLDASAA